MKNLRRHLNHFIFLCLTAVLLIGPGSVPQVQAFPSSAANGVQDSCGTENTFGKKILVVYESKRGTTAASAQNIAQVFCNNGFQVDLACARFVTDISAYDGVIIGTPIYFSKFLPGVMQFIDKHKTALSSKTNTLFIMSTLCDEGTGLPDKTMILNSFVNSVLEDYSEIDPVGEIGIFGGKYDFDDLYPVELLAMTLEGFDPRPDYVNTALVTVWAEETIALFE